ncbi:hypothetical protein CHLRE_07g345450v5 [Chlamydomonas reinhardtii]|uniref:Uncharacterized protein n=1 Tax=Chlamydomonas reinhardtii TaxID=3055 RepID=A0A2K3DKW9_CHLRE|nr:uncharacterized protein CHLRE_07g345450v5 [Chlamydomonas reinhardtii]PNW81176.1 hypothetical protein CHLRE_07g345450v5 [Chlamydomonas reinhardtii]
MAVATQAPPAGKTVDDASEQSAPLVPVRLFLHILSKLPPNDISATARLISKEAKAQYSFPKHLIVSVPKPAPSGSHGRPSTATAAERSNSTAPNAVPVHAIVWLLSTDAAVRGEVTLRQRCHLRDMLPRRPHLTPPEAVPAASAAPAAPAGLSAARESYSPPTEQPAEVGGREGQQAAAIVDVSQQAAAATPSPTPEAPQPATATTVALKWDEDSRLEASGAWLWRLEAYRGNTTGTSTDSSSGGGNSSGGRSGGSAAFRAGGKLLEDLYADVAPAWVVRAVRGAAAGGPRGAALAAAVLAAARHGDGDALELLSRAAVAAGGVNSLVGGEDAAAAEAASAAARDVAAVGLTLGLIAGEVPLPLVQRLLGCNAACGGGGDGGNMGSAAGQHGSCGQWLLKSHLPYLAAALYVRSCRKASDCALAGETEEEAGLLRRWLNELQQLGFALPLGEHAGTHNVFLSAVRLAAAGEVSHELLRWLRQAGADTGPAGWAYAAAAGHLDAPSSSSSSSSSSCSSAAVPDEGCSISCIGGSSDSSSMQVMRLLTELGVPLGPGAAADLWRLPPPLFAAYTAQLLTSAAGGDNGGDGGRGGGEGNAVVGLGPLADAGALFAIARRLDAATAATTDAAAATTATATALGNAAPGSAAADGAEAAAADGTEAAAAAPAAAVSRRTAAAQTRVACLLAAGLRPPAPPKPPAQPHTRPESELQPVSSHGPDGASAAPSPCGSALLVADGHGAQTSPSRVNRPTAVLVAAAPSQREITPATPSAAVAASLTPGATTSPGGVSSLSPTATSTVAAKVRSPSRRQRMAARLRAVAAAAACCVAPVLTSPQSGPSRQAAGSTAASPQDTPEVQAEAGAGPVQVTGLTAGGGEQVAVTRIASSQADAEPNAVAVTAVDAANPVGALTVAATAPAAMQPRPELCEEQLSAFEAGKAKGHSHGTSGSSSDGTGCSGTDCSGSSERAQSSPAATAAATARASALKPGWDDADAAEVDAAAEFGSRTVVGPLAAMLKAAAPPPALVAAIAAAATAPGACLSTYTAAALRCGAATGGAALPSAIAAPGTPEPSAGPPSAGAPPPALSLSPAAALRESLQRVPHFKADRAAREAAAAVEVAISAGEAAEEAAEEAEGAAEAAFDSYEEKMYDGALMEAEKTRELVATAEAEAARAAGAVAATKRACAAWTAALEECSRVAAAEEAEAKRVRQAQAARVAEAARLAAGSGGAVAGGEALVPTIKMCSGGAAGASGVAAAKVKKALETARLAAQVGGLLTETRRTARELGSVGDFIVAEAAALAAAAEAEKAAEAACKAARAAAAAVLAARGTPAAAVHHTPTTRGEKLAAAVAAAEAAATQAREQRDKVRAAVRVPRAALRDVRRANAAAARAARALEQMEANEKPLATALAAVAAEVAVEAAPAGRTAGSGGKGESAAQAAWSKAVTAADAYLSAPPRPPKSGSRTAAAAAAV